MDLNTNIFYNNTISYAIVIYGPAMISIISKRSYQAIYRFMDLFSPIDGDCGRLCGAICCLCSTEPDADTPSCPGDENADHSMGIYLLPGEEQIFDRDEDWIIWGSLDADEYAFPDSWHGRVPFIQCTTTPNCPREKRPLQCRTFPLAPHIDEDGILSVIYCRDPLPYDCPLISDAGQYPLNDDFIRATWLVWEHLVRDPLILDLVEMDSQVRIDEGWPVDVLYP